MRERRMTGSESNWQLLMMADDGRVIPFRHVRGIALTLLALIAVLSVTCAVLGWQLVMEKKRHRQTLAQLVDANRRAEQYKSELESNVTTSTIPPARIEKDLPEKIALPSVQVPKVRVNTPSKPTDDEQRDFVVEENLQEKEETARPDRDTPSTEKPPSVAVSKEVAPEEKVPASHSAESLPVQPSDTAKKSVVSAVDEPPPDKPVPAKPASGVPVSEKELYESSRKKFGDGDYDGARHGFEKLISEYPKSSRADNARFWIGECYYREKLYDKAIVEYRKVIENYPSGNKVPAALLKQGFSLIQIGETDRARRLLNQLISEHPKTNEAKIAKERLRFL